MIKLSILTWLIHNKTKFTSNLKLHLYNPVTDESQKSRYTFIEVGGFLHRCIHNSIKHFSGERWRSQVQQTETGSDVLTLLCRSAPDTVVSSYHHKHLSTRRYLYSVHFLFHFCICHVLEAPPSTPPPETNEIFDGIGFGQNLWLIVYIPCRRSVCLYLFLC